MVQRNTKTITMHTLLFSLFLVMFVGCVHVELPHYGEVKDAETGEPLKDVLVSMGIYTRCLWPLPHIGSDYRGRIESITDKNGRYWLPMDFTLSLPMCFAESKEYTFFKPNYFEAGVKEYSLLWGMLGGWSLGEFEVKYDTGHIYLHKMKHYLNYLPYKYPHKYNFPSYHIEDDSKYYKAYVESINKLKLNPADEYGVFLRLPDKKFTRIYSKVNGRSKSYFEGIVSYVYDETANEWSIIDGRGNIMASKPSKLPKWSFMSSDKSWGWPIYADNNKIFYPIEENPIPYGMKYNKGELQFIDSHKGNISALAGMVDNFFTIEDNGSSLCQYGAYWVEKGYYPDHPLKDEKLPPYFLNCFTGKDMPQSKDDDTITDSQFMFLNTTLNHGLFVVTKTPRYWHVYRFYSGYDEKIKDVRLFIQEIALLFPADKEITAFATQGEPFYIAFKGEGIKKYSYGKEERKFFTNSRQAKYSDIKSLAIGYALNIPALYAVTGEDAVYRFSLEDGIPDYQIKTE